VRSGGVAAFLRFAGRYLIAAVMIPVGVALGVCGLVQFAWRRWRADRVRPGSAGSA
jgi:hypothetical protein